LGRRVARLLRIARGRLPVPLRRIARGLGLAVSRRSPVARGGLAIGARSRRSARATGVLASEYDDAGRGETSDG
jgi:hypothetical protein